jgi:hypothetical protein
MKGSSHKPPSIQQASCTRIHPNLFALLGPVPAPGKAQGRKFPAVAGNGLGEILLVWAEGAGWKKGGSLAWQLFDQNNQPGAEKGLIVDSVPVWGSAAVAAHPDGRFTIVY